MEATKEAIILEVAVPKPQLPDEQLTEVASKLLQHLYKVVKDDLRAFIDRKSINIETGLFKFDIHKDKMRAACYNKIYGEPGICGLHRRLIEIKRDLSSHFRDLEKPLLGPPQEEILQTIDERNDTHLKLNQELTSLHKEIQDLANGKILDNVHHRSYESEKDDDPKVVTMPLAKIMKERDRLEKEQRAREKAVADLYKTYDFYLFFISCHQSPLHNRWRY